MSIIFVKKRVYSLTALGVIATAAGLGLAACQNQNNEPTQEDVANQSAAEMVKDQQFAEQLLTELQQKDPSIIDAYVKVNEQGKKVAVISRQNKDGSIESWTTDPIDEITKNATQNADEQTASSGGPSLGQTIMGAAVGAMMGYALANMFSGMINRSANAQQYQQQKTAAQSQYRQSVRQTQTRNAASRSSSFRRQGAFSNSNRSSAPSRSGASFSRGA